MMRSTYQSFVTDAIIILAIQKPVLHHVDSSEYLVTALPKREDNISTVMSPGELETLLDAKPERIRAGDCMKPVVLRRDYVDTTRGQVLTSYDAMKILREKEEF